MKQHVLIASKSLLLVSLATLSLIGCGNSSESSLDPSAETIISRMRQAYATCNSYQDTGVQSSTYSPSSSTDEKSFSTVFVRSEQFRFAFKDLQMSSQPSYIIWRNGADILSWWDIDPGIQTEDSLAMAIAGAYGVSLGLSGTIPSFLMPDEAGLYYTIPNAQRLDDAVVDGVNCYQVIYTFGNDQITYWIDAKTYLIRRVETLSSFNDFSTSVVTTYNPIVDGPVSDDALAFNPPLANGDVGDRLVITNITPTSVSSTETTTFTVEVSYTLSSLDSGVLSVSDQEITVSKGTGTHIFNVAELPIDTGFGSFFLVRINLSGVQQPFPLAYQEKFIIISPNAQASMSPKSIIRQLRNKQREYQNVAFPLSAR